MMITACEETNFLFFDEDKVRNQGQDDDTTSITNEKHLFSFTFLSFFSIKYKLPESRRRRRRKNHRTENNF